MIGGAPVILHNRKWNWWLGLFSKLVLFGAKKFSILTNVSIRLNLFLQTLFSKVITFQFLFWWSRCHFKQNYFLSCLYKKAKLKFLFFFVPRKMCLFSFPLSIVCHNSKQNRWFHISNGLFIIINYGTLLIAFSLYVRTFLLFKAKRTN